MSQDARFEYSGTANLEVMAEAVRYNAFLNAWVYGGVSGAAAVLDFGAGLGTFARALSARGLSVRCVEPDAAQRAVIAEAGLPVHASLQEVQPAALDLVYTLNVLEHIEDDLQALADIRRVLRHGGRLFVYVPAFQCLYSSMDQRVGHVRRYRKAELVEKLRQAGYRVSRAEYVDSLGFLAAWVYKTTDRSGGHLNLRALAFYDRWCFPVSRWLDRLGCCYWFGKNVLVEARVA